MLEEWGGTGCPPPELPGEPVARPGRMPVRPGWEPPAAMVIAVLEADPKKATGSGETELAATLACACLRAGA